MAYLYSWGGARVMWSPQNGEPNDDMGGFVGLGSVSVGVVLGGEGPSTAGIIGKSGKKQPRSNKKGWPGVRKLGIVYITVSYSLQPKTPAHQTH